MQLSFYAWGEKLTTFPTETHNSATYRYGAAPFFLFSPLIPLLFLTYHSLIVTFATQFLPSPIHTSSVAAPSIPSLFNSSHALF